MRLINIKQKVLKNYKHKKMKKIIFATAMMLTVGMTSVFANTKDEVSNQVSTSFQKDFSNAKQVQWQKETAFTKATFLWTIKLCSPIITIMEY